MARGVDETDGREHGRSVDENDGFREQVRETQSSHSATSKPAAAGVIRGFSVADAAVFGSLLPVTRRSEVWGRTGLWLS